MPRRRPLYPTDLNKRGDLCRHMREPELALQERGLLGGVSRKKAEPAVGDILYPPADGRCFVLRLIRRQFATRKFPVDWIAGMASFCTRL